MPAELERVVVDSTVQSKAILGCWRPHGTRW
jgi:hypothetical protein